MTQKERIRQLIFRALRTTRLLSLQDRTFFLFRLIKEFRNNSKFKKIHPNLTFPPYHLAYDAYNDLSFKNYYEGGLLHATFYVNTIRKFNDAPDLVVCEWGCGPARIIQHIQSLDKGIKKLIGADYNNETIQWCKKTFPQITFLKNDLAPPLSLDENSIDVLYCLSVFTHLSEQMHYAWIDEIMRVLKPGGLFIGSFHGDQAMGKLLPDELEKYQSGNIVVRSKIKEGSKNYLAFHSDEFIKNKLLSKFGKVTKIEDVPFAQTVWCAIKPANSIL